MKYRIITDRVAKKTSVSYPWAFFCMMKITPSDVWSVLKPKIYDIKYRPANLFDAYKDHLFVTFEDFITYLGSIENINYDCIREFTVLESDFNEAFKGQLCSFEPFKDLDVIEFYPKKGYGSYLQSFLISHDQKTLINFGYNPLIVDSELIISYPPRVYDILFSHGTHLAFRDHNRETEVYILTATDYPKDSYDMFLPDYWVYPKPVQQVLDKYSKVLNPSLHSIIEILFRSVLYKQDVSDVVIYLYLTYNDKKITLTRTEETSSSQTYYYQCENDSLTLHIIPKSYPDDLLPRSLKAHKILALPDSFSSHEVKLLINNQEVDSDFVKRKFSSSAN